MQTWKFSVAVAAFASSLAAVSCGDDDGGDSEQATGGRVGGSTTGGRASTGGRANTGGTPSEGGTPSDGGAPPLPEGGAPPCNGNILDTFVPQRQSDDPGPACQEYADCMEEGCGAIYEDAFGPDWAEGDLGGGACGPTVPCLEDCGCDTDCASACIFTNLDCATYALQFQACYTGCAEQSTLCQAERM